MYFIIDGECEVIVGGQQVAILGVGDFFGEAALLTDQVRQRHGRVPQLASQCPVESG